MGDTAATLDGGAARCLVLLSGPQNRILHSLLYIRAGLPMDLESYGTLMCYSRWSLFHTSQKVEIHHGGASTALPLKLINEQQSVRSDTR